jgi:predicted ATP-dependent endonuclease of OLD family
MRIEKLEIKGIASHKDSGCSLDAYTAFVGENNTGKSNVLLALRWFFSDVKLMPDNLIRPNSMVPQVDITFKLSPEERSSELFDSQFILNDCITVRAYGVLADNAPQSAKYQFVHTDGTLKDIRSKRVFGEIIFVPSVREVDDELKMTNTSTINKLLSKFVIQRIKDEDGKNQKYSAVNTAIEELSTYISSGRGSAFEQLKETLKKNMLEYPNAEIGFKLEPPAVEDLIKNCFKPLVKTYHGDLGIDSQGMGFQRSFIFSLISAVSELKVQDGTFVLYLIEEPEIFLHPNFQSLFRSNLRKLSMRANNQVVITSHSTYFLNNIQDYSELKRTSLVNHYSKINEISQQQVKSICIDNGHIMANAKNEVRNPKKNAVDLAQEAKDIAEQDELRYLLWVDPERANAFLSKKVLLVEGKTEKALFSYLMNNQSGELYGNSSCSNLSVVDVNGKFHFYKFARLLNELGISVWIMYDGDHDSVSGKISQKKLNEVIEQLVNNKKVVKCLRVNPSTDGHFSIDSDSNQKDIDMYLNLVKNKDNCKSTQTYKDIVTFLKSILAH